MLNLEVLRVAQNRIEDSMELTVDKLRPPALGNVNFIVVLSQMFRIIAPKET